MQLNFLILAATLVVTATLAAPAPAALDNSVTSLAAAIDKCTIYGELHEKCEGGRIRTSISTPTFKGVLGIQLHDEPVTIKGNGRDFTIVFEDGESYNITVISPNDTDTKARAHADIICEVTAWSNKQLSCDAHGTNTRTKHLTCYFDCPSSLPPIDISLRSKRSSPKAPIFNEPITQRSASNQNDPSSS